MNKNWRKQCKQKWKGKVFKLQKLSQCLQNLMKIEKTGSSKLKPKQKAYLSSSFPIHVWTNTDNKSNHCGIEKKVYCTGKKCDEIFWSPQVESRIIMQNFSWVTNRFWELFLWTFISLSYLQKTNLSWISWCFTVQSFFFREVNSSTLCERAAPPIRAHMVNKVPKWKVTHKLHVTCQFWLNYGWKKCIILGHKL